MESPRKRPRAEMPSGKRPTVIIETAAGERLLRELLACNSWGVRAAERGADTAERQAEAAATEEQAGALMQLARGFGLLSAVLSQREYQPRDGVEEHGEGGEGTEKEKERETEVRTDGRGERSTEGDRERGMDGAGKEGKGKGDGGGGDCCGGWIGGWNRRGNVGCGVVQEGTERICIYIEF
jgi:hypothetical protein